MDVERDIALAIYLTYTDVEETAEDETPTLSYIPFLPTKTTIPLKKEEDLSQALVLQPSTSAQPVAVEIPLVTPLASLTPLTIDGVEYLLLQDVLEVFEMRGGSLLKPHLKG